MVFMQPMRAFDQRLKDFLETGNLLERGGQRDEVAGIPTTCTQPANRALKIADMGEACAKGLERSRIVRKYLHGGLPAVNLVERG